MANKQVSIKFSGSLSPQNHSMLIKALTTDDPKVMEAVDDFFGISKKAYDGGQTVSRRAVFLMLRGLNAYLDDFEQRGTLTTKSPPPAYAVQQEQPVEIEVESELAAIDFDVDDDDFFMVDDD